MALSEGLKGFVNFFTKSFNDANDEDAFMDLIDRDGDYNTDGTLALDTMYGTRVTWIYATFSLPCSVPT